MGMSAAGSDASAETDAPAAPVAEPATVAAGVTQNAPGCLFTLRSPTNTVYLLGSMHLGTNEIYPLPSGIDRAYAESERVVFEVPPDSMDAPSVQTRLMAAGMYSDGSKLADHVPKDLYEDLTEEAKTLGIPEVAIQQFRPWMAGMTVGLMALMREGFEPSLGIEHYVLEHARRDGKLVTGLETVDFQIGLFKNLTDEQSLATLKQSLLDLSRTGELSDDLNDFWLSGDVDSLAMLTNETFTSLPEIARLFLYDRNTAWIPAIEHYIGDSLDVLVVVGAAHLGGEGGVIDLLREKGHEITGPGLMR